MRHTSIERIGAVVLSMFVLWVSGWAPAAAETRTVDVPGTLITKKFESTTKVDPTRCQVYLFVEFKALPGMVGATARLSRDGQEDGFGDTLSFPGDHFVGAGQAGGPLVIFDAPADSHWIGPINATSSGRGCGDAIKILGDWSLVRVDAVIEGEVHKLSGTIRGCPRAEPRCTAPGPLEGVTVLARGSASSQAATGQDGTYEMELADGHYDVAPTGGRFEPPTRGIDLSADQAGVDFVAKRTHRIAGTVTSCPPDSDCPVPAPADGVVVRATGAGSGEATTDQDGRYSIDVPEGTWVVAPANGETAARPTSRTVTVQRDVSGVDFRTCSSESGLVVPCSSLAVSVTTPSSSIFVDQDKDGPILRDVPIGVTIRNRGDEPIHDVDLDPQLIIGYALGTADVLPAPQLIDGARPLPLRLAPTDVPGEETRHIRIGTLQPGEEHTEALPYIARGDGDLDLTALVGYTLTPGGRTLSTTGDGSLRLDTKVVVASMAMDRWVKSPDAPALVKAGTAYDVRVKLENRSFTKRLLVWDVVAARGNAEGGHWQPPGLPIQVTHWTDLGLQACTAPPFVVLDPQQTVEADVVFRALASDPRTRKGQPGARGGIEATLDLRTPRVWIEPVDPEAEFIEVDPARLVVLDDARTIRVPIDDRAPDAAEWRGAESWLAAWTYYATGSQVAAVSWVASLLHGIIFDVPELVVRGYLEIPGMIRKVTQYEVELWEQVRKDPALLAIYSTGYGAVIAEQFKLAPKALTGGKQLVDLANQAALDHFDQMATDWYAGDWMSAASQFGSDVKTLELEIASMVAPCVLMRLPRLVEAAKAARTAELATSAEVLASKVDVATDAVRAMDVLESAASVGLRGVAAPPIKLGTAVSDPLLRQLFGLTDQQITWLREWATTAAKKGEPFLYTFRSRAAESLKWVGALLKPEEMKLKTVNWIDAAFLGFKESDIGRLVVRQPPSLAALERRLQVEGISEFLPFRGLDGKQNKNQLYQAITERYKLRLDEWLKDEPDAFVKAMQRWDDEGTVDFEYNWKENLVDPGAAPPEAKTTASFRLRPSETTSGPVSDKVTKVDVDGTTQWRVGDEPIEGEVIEWVAEVDIDGLGSWRSITGDVDGVALTDVFGQNLSDARHIELASMLAAGEMQSPHLESLSWWDRAKGFMWDDKIKNLKGVHAQIGPDGVFRLVELDTRPEALKFLRSADDYMAFFLGGYVVP